MAGLAYKWKLDDCKYGYLTDEKGGDPFITAAVVDEGPISNAVKNFTEEEYKTHYEALCVLIKNESGTQNMVMLDYKYYYNIDDTNCGLLQYGGTTYVGAQGITGTGIRSIETIYNTTNTIIRFHLTDGTYYDAVIRNGIDGVNGTNGIDGIDGEHRNVVLELENQKQDLDNLKTEILNTVTEELNTRFKSSQETLDAFGLELSGITHSIASAITTVDQVRGIEEKINFYINASALTKTEFNNIINPYSGFMETVGQRIDAVDNSVTYYQERVDLAENYYKKAISYYDAIAGNLNEYWTKYDAVNNRLENVVAELTGNSSMTLSEIYQTSREVGLVVTNNEATDINGDPITAAIVAKINDTDSTITIDASKIYMLGETVASALTTLDLDINGGYSHFNGDGSGWIANKGIYWDKSGNMTITGQLSVGDVIEGLGNSDVTFGKQTDARTIFSKDGSGSLAGGNIYWDKYGNMTITGQLSISDVIEDLGNSDVTLSKHTAARTIFSKDGSGSLAGGNIYWDNLGTLTIKKDVKIEGMLSVDEIADSLGNKIVSFGNSNTDATTYFYPDGSGSLAGGAISWDKSGNMTITGQLSVGDVIEDLGNSDITLGKHTDARTIFSKDGSGSLAGGNIYWDKYGALTIKKDVKIEGTLSVDEIADSLGNKIVSFGKSNTDATTYFYPDGSGSLAGGAISWDTDGSIKIAGNLSVAGSITQEVIGSLDGENVSLGDGTANFDGLTGSGSLGNGLIKWGKSGNTPYVKISGEVTIGDTDTVDSVVAALNTTDLSIGNGTSYFGKDGSGWLANKAIYWDDDGKLTISNKCEIEGAFNATSGKIGNFTIDENGIYYGDKDKWSSSTYKQNLAYLTPSLLRLQQSIAYGDDNEIANLKIGIGAYSDPNVQEGDGYCNSAGYFYRQMLSSYDYYYPAVQIISNNIAKRDVALNTKGAIVSNGAMIENGYYMDGTNTTVIELSKGSRVLVYVTEYQYIYLPLYSTVQELIKSSDGTFIIEMTIVAHYACKKHFILAFQQNDIEKTKYILDNDGDEWKKEVEMGPGDILKILLVWDGTNYYGYLLEHKY
jgi:hypothetical protein